MEKTAPRHNSPKARVSEAWLSYKAYCLKDPIHGKPLGMPKILCPKPEEGLQAPKVPPGTPNSKPLQDPCSNHFSNAYSGPYSNPSSHPPPRSGVTLRAL